MLGLLDEDIADGARIAPACTMVCLGSRAVQRWRVQAVGEDYRAGPVSRPRIAHSTKVRVEIVDVVKSPRSLGKSPKQIVPLLADEGEYDGSESTIYRVLHGEVQVRHRSPSKVSENRDRPRSHMAMGPNHV